MRLPIPPDDHAADRIDRANGQEGYPNLAIDAGLMEVERRFDKGRCTSNLYKMISPGGKGLLVGVDREGCEGVKFFRVQSVVGQADLKGRVKNISPTPGFKK